MKPAGCSAVMSVHIIQRRGAPAAHPLTDTNSLSSTPLLPVSTSTRSRLPSPSHVQPCYSPVPHRPPCSAVQAS